MTSFSFDAFRGPLIGVFGIAQLVLTLWLAIVVKKDADLRAVTRKGLFLGSTWLWFFGVLLSGGYLGTGAYWVIHYSSLRYRPDGQS